MIIVPCEEGFGYVRLKLATKGIVEVTSGE